MIYFFRGLTLFSILNVIPLILFGGAGGMIPVWLVITFASLILSTKKWCDFFFKKKWINVLFWIGIAFFILVEGSIVIAGGSSAQNDKNDYIIVLGAQVRGDQPSATLKFRLDAAYEYLEKHPDTKAVVSGGQGTDEVMTEASVMARYLINLGIEPERILLEEQSHTTRENLENSFAIIEEEMVDAKISLVSNRFHLLRARMQAKELGKIVGVVSARSYLYLIPNYYFREFFAVVKEIFIYLKMCV